MKLPPLENYSGEPTPTAAPELDAAPGDSTAHSEAESLEVHMQRWKLIRKNMQKRAAERRKPFDERLSSVVRRQ